MASKSKVNTRFVVTLSAVLSASVLGVAAVAYFILSNSGAELEAMGDRAMAEKDFKSAITYYGKSFADDQANIPRLEKYCNSMLAYTPENQALYIDYYWKRYIPAKMLHATLLKGDVAAQHEVLDTLTRNMYEGGFDRGGWDRIIEVTTTALAHFEAGAPAEGWELLKRYRILAWLEIAASGVELNEQQAAALESDFESVLGLDPNDEEVAIAQFNWCTINANRAADDGDTAGEAQWRSRGQTALDAYRGAHPDSVLAAVANLAVKIESAARAADPRRFSPEQRLNMMRDAAARLEPELAALFDLVRRTSPDKLDANTIYRLNRLERFVRNNNDDESAALMLRAVEASPGEPDLRYMAGRLLEDRGDREGAIAQYEALRALPIPTLSLDGIILYEQRLAALGRQAEAQMGIWESLEKPEEKEARAEALAKVKDYRDKFKLEVPPTSLALLLLEAKIAYAEDRLPEAKQHLELHLSQSNQSDPESVRLAGIVAMRLNQPGVARDHFNRLIELQPSSPRAKLLLGDVEGQLENHQAALAAYQEVLALDPENTYAKEKIQKLGSVINRVSDDPIEQAMLIADEFWNGSPRTAPDRAQAVAILEQQYGQTPDDPALIRMLATYYYNLGRLDEARAVCARGRQLDPSNTQLQNLEIVLNSDDPYDAGVILIDASPGSDTEKAIAKHRLALRYGKAPEAEGFLAEAVRLSPDDPAVIEFRFTSAITADRLEEAEALADRATQLDLDKLGGASFRARLLVARGQKAAAIDVLKAATARGMATPEIWRYLGQVQSDLARETSNARLSEDALQSLNEALRMRPSDLGAILDTLKTLVSLGRYEPALDLARRSEVHGRASGEFRDLWLRLEASVGNKERVVELRRSTLRERPNDDNNKLALLQTDVELAPTDAVARDEARALLNDLRSRQDSLLLAQLDARWHADQGDRDRARAIYLDFIAAQKASGQPMKPDPYVAFAQFLVGAGDTQGGLEALQEARQYQDPATLEVDRTLGMMLYDLGATEQAIEVLDQFLAAGAPDNLPFPHAVRARHVEALLRLKRYDDAQKSLDAAGAEANSTITLMLLQASTLQGQQDQAGALTLINNVITKFPSEPMGYVKRAEVAAASVDGIDDAIADLDTAIRLQPSLWSALQFRAVLKLRLGQEDEAMDDLRQVVKGNPAAEGPRNALLQTLIEGGKFSEAVDLANGAANQRPRDLGMLMSLGDLFTRYIAVAPEALGIAQRFYDRGWKLSPTPRVAVIYTRSLLRGRSTNPALLDLVEQVLTTPDLNMPQNPELRMNYAIMLNRRGMFDRSRAEAAQALQLVIKSPGDTSLMLDQLGPVFGDPFNGNKDDLAALIGFVQSLDMSGLPDLWADFFRARYAILDPQAYEESLSSLRRIITGAQDPTLQRVVRQFFSAALISAGETARRNGDTARATALFEEAVEVIRGALQYDPNNAEALNNGAYVLTENLKRPEEALPMAEQAVALMPNAGPFWDTLGLIYLELGRLDDAENALNRAASAGGSVDENFQIGLKIIRVKVARKDVAAAETLLVRANAATSNNPRLRASYQPQLDALRTEVDALK
jgi:tetratricopeptide (TPR) repeat protein